jgi:arginine/lysine/ornithine decarboxylase
VDQTRAPYLDALIAYASRNPGRFNVPGHKGGSGADPELVAAIGGRALEMDIPALIEGIDVPPPEPTPFHEAQRLAAEAWGARRSWFLINGASQGVHAACLALRHAGSVVVMQRNVHSSAIDGSILAGLDPAFVAPEIDSELGLAHCLTPPVLDRALADAPDAVGALCVSPTYFGACADVRGLAEVAHSHRVPLVVDEAWGAHLHFSSELPADALESGADLVVSSTHKIVGSLTQAAMLHLGPTDRLDENVVDRVVTLLESTSPSALLCASLDATRRLAATRGAELLAETIGALADARERIRAIPGLDALDERIVSRAGAVGWDPLRLAVDVRETGATGHHFAARLREHDAHMELAAETVVVATFGMGGEAQALVDRLLATIELVVAELSAEEPDEPIRFAPPPPWGPLEMPLRDAFLSAQEPITFDQAAGRIAAEPLAAYPPGIPNVLPGERLTRETLDFIVETLAHGGHLRGATDRTLATIRVVIE